MTKIKLQLKNSRAFVILFAVVVSSILLSISLGIANITLKELNFGTSAKETGAAFFAADSGLECALMYDKGASSIFTLPGGSRTISSCAGITNIPVTFADDPAAPPNTGTYSFVVTGLGSTSTSCAKVSVKKDDTTYTNPTYIKTTVISKGYNTTGSSCGDPNISNLIERQLEARY